MLLPASPIRVIRASTASPESRASYGNFDPRVGLALDPSGDGKTAIRVGAGIAHDFIRQDLHLNTSSVSPFRLTVVNTNVNLDNPWANYPGRQSVPVQLQQEQSRFLRRMVAISRCRPI